MARATVQESLRANAAELVCDERMRAAVRSPDHAEEGAWRCQDAGGRESELVEFVVVAGRVVLNLAPGRRARRRAEETAGIELGPGSQVYFRCPRCWDRVRDLYLHDDHFWCRRCHGLAYASQQESRPRWLRRAGQEAAAARRERWRQRREEASAGNSESEWDRQRQLGEIGRRLEEESRERARQRRRRYVQHTGRPGRPQEKRRYQHDDSRRVKLQPGEAYCCRCRAPRPYRYPRRAELLSSMDFTKEAQMTRIAIRARCRVCNTPVFRIVRPEEAEGLQEYWG
jgi:hypothetical protein